MSGNEKIEEQKVKWHKGLIAYGVAIVLLIGGTLGSFCYTVYQFAPRQTVVQTTANPDASHTAKLIRSDGLDVNLLVLIDGWTIYGSPDLDAQQTVDEQIFWSKDGDIVILQVAGKRIFAYDAERKQRISNAELSLVK